MKRMMVILVMFLLLTAFLTACAPKENAALPLPEVDSDSAFGVDKNIHMGTIDRYLGRDDAAYIDVRMLFDPADFGAIGGEADLTRTIEGFRIVPYPLIATLSQLPVSGAYDGPCLYALAWDENGAIVSATPKYDEAEMILRELFPRDQAIFLMCGGGGYAGMMKSLLIHLGWDDTLLYNIGGNWTYTGQHTLELAVYPEDAEGDKIYATWRANYPYIDFTRLHEVDR